MAKTEEEPTSAEGKAGDKRTESRAAAVFKPVLIETDQFAGFCLVRNISPHGMMGEVYTSFAEHIPITVHFSTHCVVRGSVIWSKERKIGVRFVEAVNVADVLSDVATKTVEGRVIRSPRVPIHCEGELIIGNRSLAIEVRDISQRGVKVRASFIQRFDVVDVQIKGLKRRKAVVHWTKDGMAGLKFDLPFSFEELALWLVRQSSDQHLRSAS